MDRKSFTLQTRKGLFVRCKKCLGEGIVYGSLQETWTPQGLLRVKHPDPRVDCIGLGTFHRNATTNAYSHARPTARAHRHTCPHCRRDWICDAPEDAHDYGLGAPCPNCDPARSPGIPKQPPTPLTASASTNPIFEAIIPEDKAEWWTGPHPEPKGIRQGRSTARVMNPHFATGPKKLSRKHGKSPRNPSKRSR